MNFCCRDKVQRQSIVDIECNIHCLVCFSESIDNDLELGTV